MQADTAITPLMRRRAYRLAKRAWSRRLKQLRAAARRQRRAAFLPSRRHPAAPLLGETASDTRSRRNAQKRERRA